MARPYKQGLEYFPWDVHAFDDPKLSSLSYQFGPFGLTVYIHLLCLVYKEGYYIKMPEKILALKLSQRIGSHWIKVDKILEIIHACVELRLLERALFLQGVITSVSIQKQFILSTKRRKNVNIDKYWLLDQATMEKLGVFLSVPKNTQNTSESCINVNNNSVNVYNNSQSKSKSKRDKLIIIDKGIYGFPKMHYLTKFLIDRFYIQGDDSEIVLYNKLFEDLINQYHDYDVLVVVRYIVSYVKNTLNNIDDKYSFLKASIYNNLEQYTKLKNEGGVSFEEWIKSRFL